MIVMIQSCHESQTFLAQVLSQFLQRTKCSNKGTAKVTREKVNCGAECGLEIPCVSMLLDHHCTSESILTENQVKSGRGSTV